MNLSEDQRAALSQGVAGDDLARWLTFNSQADYDDPAAMALLAPFPPDALMQRTSGLTEKRGFASHGEVILAALAAASPVDIARVSSLLDFGVGAGRLARMFKGFAGRYVGVDVDPDMVNWVQASLPHVDAHLVPVRRGLPFADDSFDAIVSISVFTHIDRREQDFYLRELARVLKRGGHLLMTVHGETALAKAETQPEIRDMMDLAPATLAAARAAFDRGDGFYFAGQGSHLSAWNYPYGITFANRRYVEKDYGRRLGLVRLAEGAIHDFQDIAVLAKP